MDIRKALGEELERRWTRNGRYSLRAFARDLRIHHATISRILDRRLHVTPRTIRHVGPRLGFTAQQIEEACVAANADRVARCITDSRAANSRRLAVLTGMPIDDVNVALHHLLYQRRLSMSARDCWHLQTS